MLKHRGLIIWAERSFRLLIIWGVRPDFLESQLCFNNYICCLKSDVTRSHIFAQHFPKPKQTRDGQDRAVRGTRRARLAQCPPRTEVGIWWAPAACWPQSTWPKHLLWRSSTFARASFLLDYSKMGNLAAFTFVGLHLELLFWLPGNYGP